MKRWVKYVLAVIVALVILGICWEAKGQGCPDDYGCGLFYRSDVWPRGELRALFVFNPGVQGNAIGDYGDFETWKGAPELGCTDCPTGWSCDCTTFGGDVDSNTTYIHKNDTSVEITPAGNLTGLVFYTRTFTKNEVHQFSFCYKGGTGTEDLQFGAGNVSFTDTYNWATNTWTAPLTTKVFANIGTAWTCATAYMTVGAATKTNFLAAFAASSADGTAIYVDDVRFQRLNFRGVVGSFGNVLSVPITSDPLWGDSEVLLPRVGTGPAGKWGMRLDGVDDYLSCADGTCEMDPVNWDGGGSFSVGCRLMTDTVAAGLGYIVAKYAAGGNQRSWAINRNGTLIVFAVSDDGTNTDVNTATIFTADALHSFVSTWDPSGGSGACENNIYYNAYQVDTDATMTECAPFDSTAPLEIGALTGVSTWAGSFLECVLWERKLSAIEANKYISPHFPATNYGDGFYVDTCAQAAPHATCSTQICRDGTPNTCQAEGTGCEAIFSQGEELVPYNSHETVVGDDSNPTFTGWTKIGAVTAYRAAKKHGEVSARMKRTGTDVSLTSSCIGASASTAYYAFVAAKNISGDPSFIVEYDPYTSADCTTGQQTTVEIKTGSTGAVWSETEDTKTTAVGINSLKLRIRQTSDGSAIYDTVSFKAGSYRKPWTSNPGAGTTTATARDYRLDNPLARYSEQEGADCYASGFCMDAWGWTGWAGNDGVNHTIWNIPGTAGNNNQNQVIKTATNNIAFRLYDSAGAIRNVYLAGNGTNWTAGDWKYIEVCSNNSDNVISGRFYNFANSTWYDLGGLSGAGTGIQADQATSLHLGHASGATYLDGCIPKIHISPYSAIWPMKGWNNGIPPINGKPF